MPRALIIGTGLIGASVGLALKAHSSQSWTITGYDKNPAELAAAHAAGAIDEPLTEPAALATTADIIMLATPVLTIMDWLERLAPHLHSGQLVTDVGSTKASIATLAAEHYNRRGRAAFLPGHPMAGKESGGATLADPHLFDGARWLFTPIAPESEITTLWREEVAAIGARVRDMEPGHHDEVCAWVSHLPQMLSTALAALLEDTFAADPAGLADVQAIGARALAETTRLGASPYSMWRDVALTNTTHVAATLLALEQRLQHIRENLRTPELREEFATANRFRAQTLQPAATAGSEIK